jgi:hypothetical protein
MGAKLIWPEFVRVSDEAKCGPLVFWLDYPERAEAI